MLRWLVVLALAVVVAGPGCSGEDGKKSGRRERRAQPQTAEADRPPPEPEQPPEKPADPEPAKPEEKPPAVVLVEGIDPESPAGKSLANLKVLGEAMKAYVEKEKKFPANALYSADEKPLLSWRVLLLPYLGQEKLFAEFKLGEPWDSAHNKELIAKMPDVFNTPGGPGENKTCYLVPVGLGTIFAQRQGMAATLIGDGLDRTLLVVEADADKARVWTEPEDLQFAPFQPTAGLGKLRENAFLATFADASVRAVNTKLDKGLLRALFTANGKERLQLSMLDVRPGEEPPADSGFAEGMLGDAVDAFANADPRRGVVYLMADGIVRAHEDVMGTLQWSAGLKRPMLIVRWGLAVNAPDLPTPNSAVTPRAEMTIQAMQYWDQAVGRPFIGRLGNRVQRGDFGKWLVKKDRTEGGGGGGGGGIAANVAVPGGNEAGMETIATAAAAGVTLLGTLEQGPARAAAAKDGLDVVAVARVQLKPVVVNRQAQMSSTIDMKLIDVQKGTLLHSAKPLEMGKPGSETQMEGQTNVPIFAREWIGAILEYIEGQIALTEMPKLSPEVVRMRADSLVAEKRTSPLPALFEIRYYESRKLLKPEEVSAYYAKILGPEDGPRLATGTIEQRKELTQKLLDQQ